MIPVRCLFAIVLVVLPLSIYGCPSGFHFNDRAGRCYKALGDLYTWWGASNACQAIGGSLVTIANGKQQDAVVAATRKLSDSKQHGCATATKHSGGGYFGGYWTAGQRISGKSFVWRAASGSYTPFDRYDNWENGEPNNRGGVENCMHLFRDGFGRQNGWNDASCDRMMCAVCEA